MAFTNTGFKRSMKITITKTGNDNSVASTTYNGQDEFTYNNVTYPAIVSDNDFRRLVRNGVDADWDVRLTAFKNYVLGKVGQTVYDLIDWNSNVVIPIDSYDIKIMAIANTQGTSIISIVYKNGVLASTLETVNVYFDTLDKTGVQLQIANSYLSGVYEMDQLDGDIRDLSNPTISPLSSTNGVYNLTIDTINEWGQ